MRWNNGFGALPKLRSSSVAAFGMNEAASLNAVDLLGPDTIASADDIIPAPTGFAKRFNGATGAIGPVSAATATALNDQHTVGLLFRPTIRPSGTSQIIAAFGDTTRATAALGSGTGADNILYFVAVSSSGYVIAWEFGTGGTDQVTVPAEALPIGQWAYLTVRWTLNGADWTVSIAVNGYEIANRTTAFPPSGGANGQWQLGGQTFNSGTLNLPAQVDIAALYLWDEALDINDIVADHRRLRGQHRPTYLCARLVVQNIDLTNFAGQDFVKSIQVDRDLDRQVSTCQATLIREAGQLSLAPLRTDSVINMGNPFDPTSYRPLLGEGQNIRADFQRVLHGQKPIDANWQSWLEGCIDTVDPGGQAGITVQFRDQGGELVDAQVEQEVRNDSIDTDVLNEPEKQPSYGLLRSAGGQNISAAVQDLLDDNDNDGSNNTAVNFTYTPRPGSYDPTTLYTPYTIDFFFLPWRQRKEPVMSAIQKAAVQAAATLGYKYGFNVDTAAEQWSLTLEQPLTQREDVDLSVLACEVLQVSSFKRSLNNHRNVVRGVYLSDEGGTLPTLPVNPDDGSALLPNAAFTAFGRDYFLRQSWFDLNGENNRQIAFVEIEATTALSEVNNKRKFMEIVQASTDQIATVGENFAFVFSVLRSLEITDVGAGVTLAAYPELEPNDMVSFASSPLHTASQRLAAYRVSTIISGSQQTTGITLRGRPSIGFRKLLDIEARPGSGHPPISDPHDALTDLQDARTQAYIRKMLDESRRDSGGKYLQIVNPGFDQMTAGKEKTPDGWFLEGPEIWRANFNIDEGLASIPNSGFRSMRVGVEPLGRLTSKLIPIDGRDDTPYAVEVVWKRTVASGAPLTEGLAVHLDWYSDTKLLGVPPDYAATAGAGVFLGRTSVVFTANGDAGPHAAWIKETNEGEFIDAFSDANAIQSDISAVSVPTAHPEGIVPPAGTKFVRLGITQFGGQFGLDDMLLDFVSIYKKARETRAVFDNVGIQAIAAGAAGVVVEFDSVAPADGGIDHGSNFDTVAFRFVAPEKGRYKASAGVSIQEALGTPVVANEMSIDLYKNGVAQTFGQTSRTSNQAFVRSNVQDSIELDVGDTLEVRANLWTGTGGYVVRTLSEETFFHVKQQQNE